MSSMVSNVGREVEVVALGKVWVVGRFDVDVLDKFLDWVRPQLPDPFAGLDRIIDKLPEESAVKLIREAQDKKEEYATLDYASPIVQKFRATQRGHLVSFWHLLQVNHPDATYKEAFEIAQTMGKTEEERRNKLNGVFEDAAGRPPVLPNAQAPGA